MLLLIDDDDVDLNWDDDDLFLAAENAFKEILTVLEKPDGGVFGKYYSLPSLNDPRISNFLFS